jgi:hypothetical protein
LQEVWKLFCKHHQQPLLPRFESASKLISGGLLRRWDVELLGGQGSLDGRDGETELQVKNVLEERRRERDRNREKDRQRETESEREKDRNRERQRETERDRDRQRQTKT